MNEPAIGAARLRGILIGGTAALMLGYAAIWWLAPLSTALLRALWFVPVVGLFGATIANTSGTGGGVVFVPVFSILRDAGIMTLGTRQVVATSFLIQCFGMSMGALRWSTGLYRAPAATGPTSVRPARRDYWTVVAIVLLLSLPVMLATQRLAAFDPHGVLLAFKCFSILLGVAVVGTTWTVNRTQPPRTKLARADLIVLALLGALGGFVTALFSVGVGELVALYLFIRHYPVMLCTGTAVTVSAISVIAAAPFAILAGHVSWEVVALAAPGALLGGFLARPLALWLGANRLKTIDGLWIIASSLYLILLNV